LDDLSPDGIVPGDMADQPTPLPGIWFEAARDVICGQSIGTERYQHSERKIGDSPLGY
jgi:hypothetical protein